MKHIILQLAAAALLISWAQARDPIGVNAAYNQQAELAGKTVTVTGLVDRVSTARRMVILIDTSEAGCADACERKNLVVQLPDSIELPAKGASITAIGTFGSEKNPPQLAATTIAIENR